VYIVDARGELESMPAEWTDIVSLDTFVTVSAGRSPFHIDGLLEPARVVEELTARQRRSVKETSP
jgi:hypothetical protein